MRINLKDGPSHRTLAQRLAGATEDQKRALLVDLKQPSIGPQLWVEYFQTPRPLFSSRSLRLLDPGPHRLFPEDQVLIPECDENILDALACADIVLSDQPAFVFAALANKRRAFYLGTGTHPSLASVTLSGDTSESQIEEKCSEISWPEVWEHISAQREALGSSHVRRYSQEAPLHFASLCGLEHFPSLVGLWENLSQLTQGFVQGKVLALDNECAALIEKHLPLEVVRMGDLWKRSELSQILSRPIAEQAFIGKPHFLCDVSKIWDRFLYTDVDIHFHSNPTSLLETIKGPLLFPHWCDALPNNRRHGLYNAGLLAFGPNSHVALDWWKIQTAHECRESIPDGQFYDQGYLDLFPLLFPETQVYRKGDHNRGSWNERTFLGQAPKSFHASSPDLENWFSRKIFWDQLHTLNSQLSWDKNSRFQSKVLEQQRRHYPQLDDLLVLISKFPSLSSLKHQRGFLARTASHFSKVLRRRRPLPVHPYREWIDWQRTHLTKKESRQSPTAQSWTNPVFGNSQPRPEVRAPQ